MAWTILNRDGKVVNSHVEDLIEWLKLHSDVLIVARLEAIHTIIIA